MPEAKTNQRRWYQFSLRTLLIFTAAVAILAFVWVDIILPRLPFSFAGREAGEERTLTSLEMKFCWCPAGEYMMGSPKEETGRSSDEDQVWVTLSRGFWLAKYEVTQGDWQTTMGTTGREQRDKGDRTSVLHFEGATYPMYYVNHHEATRFCEKLTDQERRAGRLPEDWEYRLPTEAQWEYACRAGTRTATAFGDKLTSEQANFNGDDPYNGAAKGEFLERTAPVGSYKANAWGLHDMHGNVWEWCRDYYQKELPGGIDPEVASPPRITKRGWDRVARGGCWFSEGRECRSAERNRGEPDARVSFGGFRIALVQLR